MSLDCMSERLDCGRERLECPLVPNVSIQNLASHCTTTTAKVYEWITSQMNNKPTCHLIPLTTTCNAKTTFRNYNDQPDLVRLSQEERPVPQFDAIMGWTVTQIHNTPTPALVYTCVLLQVSNFRKSKQCWVAILPYVQITKAWQNSLSHNYSTAADDLPARKYFHWMDLGLFLCRMSFACRIRFTLVEYVAVVPAVPSSELHNGVNF